MASSKPACGNLEGTRGGREWNWVFLNVPPLPFTPLPSSGSSVAFLWGVISIIKRRSLLIQPDVSSGKKGLSARAVSTPAPACEAPFCKPTSPLLLRWSIDQDQSDFLWDLRSRDRKEMRRMPEGRGCCWQEVRGSPTPSGKGRGWGSKRDRELRAEQGLHMLSKE